MTDGRQSLGELALAVFFVSSGFLITRSGLGCRSTGRFLWHRFLRIFPAYWVCLLVSAFVFYPLFQLIKHGAFSADASLAYLRGNWAIFHFNGLSIEGVVNFNPPTIGRVLNGNPYPWTLNGSLWSLPYECACYLVLALFAWAGILRRGRLGIVVLFGGLWALYAFSCLDAEYFKECFPYRCFQLFIFLAVYFSAGCVCYLYRASIPASKTLFAAALVLLAVGLCFGSFGLVAPMALSYASLCLAFWLPIRRFDALGDFSYGTYIYAFPVQQGLALLRVPQQYGLAVFLGSTVVITLVLAVLSYRCIEAPSLRWKEVDLLRAKNLPRSLPTSGGSKVALALVPERAE